MICQLITKLIKDGKNKKLYYKVFLGVWQSRLLSQLFYNNFISSCVGKQVGGLGFRLSG